MERKDMEKKTFLTMIWFLFLIFIFQSRRKRAEPSDSDFHIVFRLIYDLFYCYDLPLLGFTLLIFIFISPFEVRHKDFSIWKFSSILRDI